MFGAQSCGAARVPIRDVRRTLHLRTEATTRPRFDSPGNRTAAILLAISRVWTKPLAPWVFAEVRAGKRGEMPRATRGRSLPRIGRELHAGYLS